MSEKPQKPKSAPQTRPCAKCGKQMPAARSVCPECGNMTGWFKARLYLGCLFLGLGGLVIIGTVISAIFGPIGQ